jgi:hypothetical protein
MNHLSQKISLAAIVLLTALSACQNDKEVAPDENKEHSFIRLLVSDENTKQIALVNPQKKEVQFFEGKFAKSAVYVTESGRYGVLVHRENHYVEKFDTGFENHGDHADVKGTPKWAAMVGDGKLPTHFASHGDEVAIFNDGDGTFDIAKETDFHNQGAKMRRVNVGNAVHHGAMLRFTNGLYAVTEKDGSIAGVLPERVKIVNTNGQAVSASTIQTKGIHGDATDGQVGLFGSASGILAVQANGTQKLIPHPQGFGAAWFGTILYAPQAKKFIGYTAAMGAYLIDPATDRVVPIIENKDIMQCKVDYLGERLHVLLHNGELHIFDLATNTLLKKGNVIPAVEKTDTQKPTLVATNRFVYLAMPKAGEVYQIAFKNLAEITKIKVSSVPYRISVVGIETSQGHD